ncbi:hypothetical protein ACHAO8_000429 [Botrytis cinerea]
MFGKQDVATPGSSAYIASLESYFSALQSAVQPSCIVYPQNVQDVSAAVAALTKTKQNGNCSFAIRSGGHTSWAGASNIQGGVVIDLSALNAIDLATDRSTVSVGVGASWDLVYEKLDPLGLSVNGGRAAGVGKFYERVGGLTLGGGISFFSPRYGWTCDTVTNFQVVLADGSIVEANTANHSDLFFALKGGNNNFGIITRVDLRTFKQGLIWTGTVYNAFSSVDEVISEFTKINSVDAYDVNASLITSFGFSQARGLSVISNQLAYTNAVESPSVYKGLLDLPNLFNTSQLVNMTTLSKSTEALQPNGARSFSLVLTLASKAEVLKAAYSEWNATVPAITDVSNLTWALALEPLPPAIYARHAKHNALGLDNRSESLVVALISATWKNAADDVLVTKTANSLLDSIKEATGELGGLDPYIYLNYAGQYQDPIASYGSKSVNRLQQVRNRVDPHGVFTHQVPGGYKIPSL